MKTALFSCVAILLLTGCAQRPAQPPLLVLTNLTLIDGNGSDPRPHTNLYIRGDSITAIRDFLTDSVPADATRYEATGLTAMPEFICCHAHLGLLKGTVVSAANYSRDNIVRQLEQYQRYGVGAVLSLGTDEALIWALRDSSRRGLLPGAKVFTAGYGFGAPGGVPPAGFGDQIFRPRTPAEAVRDVDRLAPYHPDVIKLWLDDGGGKLPKMDTVVYRAIIQEAHKQGIRVAAHVFYLADARRLVDDGVDALAHSVRDAEIDNALLAKMKARHVVYIPTLSLDEFQWVYSEHPSWMQDSFFKASLEPGVYEMLMGIPDKVDTSLPAKKKAFLMAMHNVKRVYDAGITVVLGTDSGAQPARAQGFAEHRELQLLVQAGLTPLEAIQVATSNSATFLRVADRMGTLEPGKRADFILLRADPADTIENTEQIAAVWQDGVGSMPQSGAAAR